MERYWIMRGNSDSWIYVFEKINDVIFYLNYSPNHKCFDLKSIGEKDFKKYYEKDDQENPHFPRALIELRQF